MGLLGKLFGGKGKKFEGLDPREWSGQVFSVAIPRSDRSEHPSENEWLGERRRRSVWVAVRTVPNRNGDPKVELFRDGYLVAEIPAAKVKRSPELQSALQEGVTVAVMSISRDSDEAAWFGDAYKYRPRPEWER